MHRKIVKDKKGMKIFLCLPRTWKRCVGHSRPHLSFPRRRESLQRTDPGGNLFNNKGMTLVELLVSMGLFAVVMTLTVGFFITMQKMQMTYRDAANLQQEGRIVSEIFSRYAREAKAIII